jgi:hypothetical protein
MSSLPTTTCPLRRKVAVGFLGIRKGTVKNSRELRGQLDNKQKTVYNWSKILLVYYNTYY